MKLTYLSLLAILPVASASAVTLYDFESSDYVVQTGSNRTPLPSSSWTQVGSNATSEGVEYPISYTESWSNVTGGSGQKAGAIGTAIANSADTTVSVYGSLNGQGAIANTKITTTIAITDSVADYPIRDTFGMEIRGTGNASLATLTFSPVDPLGLTSTGWYVSYTTASGTVQIATPIVAQSEYNFSLTFLASGVELNYAPADNSSSNTVYFLPAGYDSTTSYQDIGFSVTQTAPIGASSNFMRFDNITLTSVPEASTLALAGLGLAGLTRRRRL